MKRTSVALPLLLGFGVLYAEQTQQKTDKPYNVLFISLDDLRPDLGCYGNPVIKSPNIDQLAKQGLLFERAYCQVAVCNPSRNALLSGLRPDTTGIYDNSKYIRVQKPDALTLPQHFKNNGYITLSMGKIYHHSESEPGDDPLSWSEPMFGFGKPYRQWFTKESDDFIKKLKSMPDRGKKAARALPYEAADQPDDDYPDGKTALKAIEQLQRVKDQPFFLAVGFIKPHLPLCCPQKYWDLYPAATMKLPDNYYPPKDVPPMALQSNYEMRSYGGVPETGPITDEMALNIIRGYRACISFADAQVGRVIDELDRLGLRENTIIILWGDNGYHLGENSLWTKMTNFELGTHVPLIISVPRQKTAGQTTKALVEFVDIYPSLAELCGLTIPPELEGTSFVPLINNPDLPWKKAAFSQYGRGRSSSYNATKDPMGYTMRTDRYRYTEWIAPDKKVVGVELYDQQADPQDNVNLANHPEQKNLVAELSKQLHAGWKAALPRN